jgi:hypothetical protein
MFFDFMSPFRTKGEDRSTSTGLRPYMVVRDQDSRDVKILRRTILSLDKFNTGVPPE